MNIKIFISFVICKIAHGFIPQQNVNVCVFKTGPGQVNLLTLATNKMLKTNDAFVICNDNVSDDIKSIINCHKMTTVSEYKDLDDMMTDAATELLNEHSIYRVMPYDEDINKIELSVYKKWGLQVLMFPGVNENIQEY